jgi:hypothetical protein
VGGVRAEALLDDGACGASGGGDACPAKKRHGCIEEGGGGGESKVVMMATEMSFTSKIRTSTPAENVAVNSEIVSAIILSNNSTRFLVTGQTFSHAVVTTTFFRVFSFFRTSHSLFLSAHKPSS